MWWRTRCAMRCWAPPAWVTSGPTSAQQTLSWSRAPGRAFLTETSDRVRSAGFDIGNVAVQLIGDRPRLGERRVEAEQVLSELVGAPVSLSATTTDGLGLTGRGEGIAAIATALLVKPDRQRT